MNRYILTIKRDFKSTRTHHDLLQGAEGIPGLEIVGGSAGWLVVHASSGAIRTLKARISPWCHVEKEALYRPSIAG